jgi:hypothetical protein
MSSPENTAQGSTFHVGAPRILSFEDLSRKILHFVRDRDLNIKLLNLELSMPGLSGGF